MAPCHDHLWNIIDSLIKHTIAAMNSIPPSLAAKMYSNQTYRSPQPDPEAYHHLANRPINTHPMQQYSDQNQIGNTLQPNMGGPSYPPQYNTQQQQPYPPPQQQQQQAYLPNMAINQQQAFPQYQPQMNMMGLAQVNLFESCKEPNINSFISLGKECDSCSLHEYMQPTISAFPRTVSLSEKCGLPFALIVKPNLDIKSLAKITINPSQIIRCRDCRAYINPFCKIIGPRAWKCPICHVTNAFPEFFDYDPTTRALLKSKNERPELRYSVIDFVASVDYHLRAPQPPATVFLLDVSASAINSGMVATVCKTILDNFENISGDNRRLFGLMAYNAHLHYFKISHSPDNTKDSVNCMTITDINNMFIPSSESLLVNIREFKHAIKKLIESVPVFFQHSGQDKNCFGVALKAVHQLLSPTGGKIIAFQYTLPSEGPSVLADRESAEARKFDQVSKNIRQHNEFYKDLALDYIRKQISLNIFFFNGKYNDIATIAPASVFTAGSIHYFPDFNTALFPSMVEQLESELKGLITKDAGMEAVLRIRPSLGIKVGSFEGNCFVKSHDLLTLPSISSDNVYALNFKLEQDIKDDQTVTFQSAVLYTNTNGERHIQVATIQLPIVDSFHQLYDCIHPQAMATYIGKLSVDKCIENSLSVGRSVIQQFIIKSLKHYRAACAETNTMQILGGLPGPKSFSSLIKLLFGALKTSALAETSMYSLDERTIALLQIKRLSITQLSLIWHPLLFPLHTINNNIGTYDAQNHFILPSPLLLSAESLARDGIYLLYDSLNIFIYISNLVNPNILKFLFNANTYHDLPPRTPKDSVILTDIPVLDNPYNYKIRAIVTYLKSRFDIVPSLFVIKQDDKRNIAKFRLRLIMDRSYASDSFVEYLFSIEQQTKGALK